MSIKKIHNPILFLIVLLLVLYACLSPEVEDYLELFEKEINLIINLDLELDIFLRFLIMGLGVSMYSKLRIKKIKEISES